MTLLVREPDARETTVLRQRQAVLEEVVRRCSRHAAGTRAPGRYAGGANVLAEVLGDRLLVEYAAVGPQLVAAVLDGGRCRLVRLSSLLKVREAVAGLRLALRAALVVDAADEALGTLAGAGRAVQNIVLAPLGLPASREVVIANGTCCRHRGRSCLSSPTPRWS